MSKIISRRNFLISLGLGLAYYLVIENLNIFKSEWRSKIMAPDNMANVDIHNHLATLAYMPDGILGKTAKTIRCFSLQAFTPLVPLCLSSKM